jgi:hypothetical protein
MDNTMNDRRIPVYKLVLHKQILSQLLSFSATVDRCNFTIKYGALILGSKTYVDAHGMEEYKPVALRGVELLDIHYLKLTDEVVLTEDQHKDYRTLVALN